MQDVFQSSNHVVGAAPSLGMSPRTGRWLVFRTEEYGLTTGPISAAID